MIGIVRNCLFRALSVGFHDHQSAYAQLRTLILNNLVDHGSAIFVSVGFVSDDSASIAKAADVMLKTGT